MSIQYTVKKYKEVILKTPLHDKTVASLSFKGYYHTHF